MGDILKRTSKTTGKVSYQVRVRVTGHPTVTETFPKLAEAKRFLAEVEATVRSGGVVVPDQTPLRTLMDAVDRYLVHELPRKSRESVVHQGSHLRWWAARLGSRRLEDVTAADVVEGRDELLQSRGPATCNRYVASLSAMCSTAVREWQWIRYNPCHGVRRLTEPAGRVRFLSAEELPRFLKACRESTDPYLHPAALVALNTGMRRGELKKLKWKDVDLHNRTISLFQTKNGTTRGVPMSAETLEAFNVLRQLPSSLDGRIFLVSGEWPRVPLRDVLAATGIPDFHWHDLRHTAASYMAMSGIPLRTMGEILGQKTMAMTMRYAHLSVQHLSDALAGLGKTIAALGQDESGAILEHIASD